MDNFYCFCFSSDGSVICVWSGNTCYGRLVVLRCGDGSVCCCRFCVVPVRNPLVWWSYVRSVSTKSLPVGVLLHLSSPSSLVFVCGL